MRGNNSVLYALDNLSRTVRGLGRDKGQHDISMENIGLQRSRQDYDINRQTRADERADELHEQGAPGRELGMSKAKGELAQRGKLFNMGSLGVNAIGHLSELSKGEPDKIQYQRLVRDLGYKTTPEGDTVHEDGSLVYEHQVDKQKLTEWVMSHFDSDKSIESQKDIALLKLASDNDGRAYDTTMKAIKNKPTGIDARIASAKKRRNIMAGMGSNTDKIDARIDKLYSEKDADKRAAATTKAEVGIKDTRSSKVKLMDYYAEYIFEGDRKKAIATFRSDEQMAEKLRAYISTLDARKSSLRWMNLTSAEQKAEIDALQVSFGIKPTQGATPAPIGARQELLPGQDKPESPSWKTHDN